MNQISSHASFSFLKKIAKKGFIDSYGLQGTRDVCVLIALQDAHIEKCMVEACSSIGLVGLTVSQNTYITSSFVSRSVLPSHDLLAFDVLIYDNNHEGVHLMECMKSGIVPIVPKKNTFSSLLKEFNPLEYTGNAFLFSDLNHYQIFEKLIIFLENMKFPQDKKILLKNVEETF